MGKGNLGARRSIALISLIAAGSIGAQPAPQPSPDWKAWSPLFGTWTSDPSPDGSTGSFTLTPELQGRILVRRNRAEYPETKNRPAFRHEDLMSIWQEAGVVHAKYWDNEGHVISYLATADTASKTYVFVSDAATSRPRFRLTYRLATADAMSLAFEIAPPDTPDQFKPYLSATLHRAKK